MELGKHGLEMEEEKNGGLGLHNITHGFERDIETTATKVVDGSLRSGRKVEWPGSIVVLGDVNAGAEVIAEEHIIILGTLRGLAHAGAKGNRKAMIVANEIDAQQLRIADIVKEIERPDYDYDEDGNIIEKTVENDEDEYYDDIIKTRAIVKNNEIVLE